MINTTLVSALNFTVVYLRTLLYPVVYRFCKNTVPNICMHIYVYIDILTSKLPMLGFVIG